MAQCQLLLLSSETHHMAPAAITCLNPLCVSILLFAYVGCYYEATGRGLQLCILLMKNSVSNLVGTPCRIMQMGKDWVAAPILLMGRGRSLALSLGLFMIRIDDPSKKN